MSSFQGSLFAAEHLQFAINLTEIRNIKLETAKSMVKKHSPEVCSIAIHMLTKLNINEPAAFRQAQAMLAHHSSSKIMSAIDASSITLYKVDYCLRMMTKYSENESALAAYWLPRENINLQGALKKSQRLLKRYSYDEIVIAIDKAPLMNRTVEYVLGC